MVICLFTWCQLWSFVCPLGGNCQLWSPLCVVCDNCGHMFLFGNICIFGDNFCPLGENCIHLSVHLVTTVVISQHQRQRIGPVKKSSLVTGLVTRHSHCRCDAVTLHCTYEMDTVAFIINSTRCWYLFGCSLL